MRSLHRRWEACQKDAEGAPGEEQQAGALARRILNMYTSIVMGNPMLRLSFSTERAKELVVQLGTA